jgi:hypothetical protein
MNFRTKTKPVYFPAKPANQAWRFIENGQVLFWHKRGADIMHAYRIIGMATIGFTILIDPAFAGLSPAPGPIAGIGLPALAIIGGAYWIGRKLFAGKK